jgi:predicted RNA-binding protein with PUA domain
VIRICQKCRHITGQRRCVYCGKGEPGSNYVRRPAGLRPTAHGAWSTRQQYRREVHDRAMRSVNEKNLLPIYDHRGERVGWSGMPRRERRKLARAYAAGL